MLDLLVRLESGETPEGETELAAIPDVAQLVSDASFTSPWRRKNTDQLTRLPFADAIYRLSPGTWLISPGDQPEVTLRLAIVMPGVLPLGGSGSLQLVTLLRGQRREELLMDLLRASPRNDWIQSLRSTWHWGDGVDWTPAGSGTPRIHRAMVLALWSGKSSARVYRRFLRFCDRNGRRKQRHARAFDSGGF